RVLGPRFTSPLVRGPARMVESFAFLPELKRALPEAQLPFARGKVVGSILGSAIVMQGVRRSRLGAAAKELVGGLLSVAPALLSLREGSVAAYHGAEHITIGTYEHGEKRAREHERCGSHLVGPLLATATAGNILASRVAPRFRPAARAAAAVGPLATSTETFAWMQRPHVVVQAFQKHDAYLGGMDEAIAILKLCSHDWDGLTVRALHDGDPIAPYEPVLTIEGDYTAFAHLETVYLGTLARRTLITTNVVRVLEAANGKPIIFMPARHDHYRVQTGDGYAAYVAGRIVGAPIGVTTDDQASWWG